jgi:hypothetical protein
VADPARHPGNRGRYPHAGRVRAAEVAGRIGTVVRGIPLVLPPRAERRRFIDAIETVARDRTPRNYPRPASGAIPNSLDAGGEGPCFDDPTIPSSARAAERIKRARGG